MENTARRDHIADIALGTYMERAAARNVPDDTALRNYMENAVQDDDIDALYALIRRDPTILNHYDKLPFENTPLHIAASTGNIEFAMEMMNLKPSFARKLNRYGSSPLHLALEHNRVQMVRLLVTADKDLVRVKGREGMTPFHRAVAANNLEALSEFLVACPECIVDANIRGQTALHIAATGDMMEGLKIMVHWLRRNNYKDGDVWQHEVLNAKDNGGNTMIRLLLNSSVEKNLTNVDNMTPLDILQRQGNDQESQKILKTAGGLNAANLPDIPTLPAFLQTKITLSELTSKSADRQRRNLSSSTRSALLVVAGLMVTATYNAALNPPGGISPGPCPMNSTSTTNATTNSPLDGLTVQDNPLGKSVLSSTYFLIFYTLNTLCFFLTSLVIFQFLITDAPDFIIIVLGLSLGFLFSCYLDAILAIAPTFSYVIAFVVSALLTIPTRLWQPRRSRYGNYLRRKYIYKRHQDGGFWWVI
ncbi:hypothetical protein F3Y22_tig00111213pilonHSYRG00480 [Hibiscus syriacus]|uniref:Uncharacterized protein n=1 Tax=Hibiscus syriacus TaxID=106335 RepID=A0A6A2YV29_HIBSY|nr:hypothetical protein F3Y22_tig00111213pilonHSYRG00480 [Hibiscus syriacus]